MIVEEDNRNYHCFKLTTQYDRYRRKLIKNWKEKGLLKKSYVRIEMPLKVEEKQFKRKITSFTEEEMLDMYKELYDILNIEVISKLGTEEKETVQS